MPTEDSFPRPSSASSSVSQPTDDQFLNARRFGHILPESFQLGGANVSRIIRPRQALPILPILPVDDMLYFIMRQYQSNHNTAFVRNPPTTIEHSAHEDTFYTESHLLHSQQVTINNQELVSPLEPLLNDNPWAEEVTDIILAGPAAADGECGPRRSAIIRSKLVRALVGGVVSLIVLPGIILGVLMKQTMAGIALSSTITALANLFAGIYYYINKRD